MRADQVAIDHHHGGRDVIQGGFRVTGVNLIRDFLLALTAE